MPPARGFYQQPAFRVNSRRWNAGERKRAVGENMTTTKTKCGRLEHGKPERGEGGCWHRLDRYFSDDQEYAKLTDPEGKGLIDRIACAGRDDDSGYNDGRYEGERCPCCYLGHAHTVALHERYVSSAKADI